MTNNNKIKTEAHISERVRKIVEETMKIRGNKRLIDYKEEAEILQNLINSGELSEQETEFVQQNLNTYKKIVCERARQYRIEQLENEINAIKLNKVFTQQFKDKITAILEDTTEDGSYTENTFNELKNMLNTENLNNFDKQYIESLIKKA